MVDTLLTGGNILAALSANAETLREMGVLRIGLFGSHRRGTQRPDSDVDILVTLVKLTFDGYMNIRFFLEDLVNRKVDLKPALRSRVLSGVAYAEEL